MGFGRNKGVALSNMKMQTIRNRNVVLFHFLDHIILRVCFKGVTRLWITERIHYSLDAIKIDVLETRVETAECRVDAH